SLLLLQEERATGSSDERKIIAAGLSSCRRMMELLDLYLEVSRLDAKEVAVSVEDVELEPLVRSVAEAQAPLASSRKISVSLAVPSGLSARADAALLRRVVENLLNNAIKFSPVSGSARIEAAASGAAVSLSFRDSGRGVPKEDLPSLFERYRGAEAQLGETRCGASLGLAFCRQALELMGGSIAARSRPGRGGEFVVSLPRSE
ncbi:MAG: HAMP domain-containing histidine kinase, partial [Elusimicrobia bacterium]|nr:HAMP domain-containing histidine kinase [Elusimicrobiota bacterium]